MSGKRRDYLTSYTVDANGCWNYSGTINNRGYGTILGKCAHRWFYEQIVGTIGEGLQLDHLCLNKACVRPSHLEPVTGSVNQSRRVALMTSCSRGHALPENYYVRPNGRRECGGCRYERWAESLGREVQPVGRPRQLVSS